jgi:hypothetical protein
MPEGSASLVEFVPLVVIELRCCVGESEAAAAAAKG